MREKREMDLDGMAVGALGGVDGGEIAIRMPDMTKESIFSKRKKIKERLTAT